MLALWLFSASVSPLSLLLIPSYPLLWRIALLPEDEILLRQKRNALFPDNRLALPDVGIGY